jgi:hypothetical protein
MEQVIVGAQIYKDVYGSGYYELNTESGVQYDIRFPLKLATDCFAYNPKIGPEHCNNCRDYGSYKGMIIALCGNCTELASEEYKCDCTMGPTSQEFNIYEQLTELRIEGFMAFGCNSTNCIYKTYLEDLPFEQWDELYTDAGKYRFASTSISSSTTSSASTSVSSDEEDLYSVATDEDSDSDYDIYKNAKVADINSPIRRHNHIIYISSASEDEQADDDDEQVEEEEEEDDVKEEKEEGEISDDEVVYIPPPYVTSRSKGERPRKAQLIANDLCGQDSDEFEQYLDSIYL